MECQINHREICELLYAGETEEAVRVFVKRSKGIALAPFYRTMYLSSLNFAIYNFILLKEKVSLHECCMENEKKVQQSTNDVLLDTGTDIILSYGYNNQYLVEKYQNPHIKNAISYIHSHLHEPLSLSLVSAAICINKIYLCQLFVKEVQMGFCDYVFAQRMKRANQLLLKTDLSIQNIAEDCGFRSASYFSTCYRKYMGYPPSEARKH